MDLSLATGSSVSYTRHAIKEMNLLANITDKNYEDSGVDVTLTLKPPELPIKKCASCEGKHTPLWRNGPHGPKTACNACGIRFRKEELRLNTNLTLAPSSAQAPARRI